MGKEAFELVIELRRERLVVGHHQSRTIERLDHFGHGECLPRSGDAQQDLMLFAVEYAAGQCLDGRSLVALWFVAGNEFEIHGRSL